MKDYNLHYYYLKLPLDATTEEVEQAYQDEVKACARFAPHHMQERMVILRSARETLAIPANRKLYHEEKREECYLSTSTRKILKATGFWPVSYVPRRPGPMPDSFEGSRSSSRFAISAADFRSVGSGRSQRGGDTGVGLPEKVSFVTCDW